MTKTEYDALPQSLQFDVRVALACGYTMDRIQLNPNAWYGTPFVRVLNNSNERADGPMSYNGWQTWFPTTDPTIWTALMDYRDRCNLMPKYWPVDQRWLAWFDKPYPKYRLGNTKGEAVCAAFVAAYGKG